ncbi:hypothetical protein B0H14DRAFT_2821794 [Mycena olivaceomarginata]|nr:hypothetical protein B0H14DRAFT_2821794 [Mycena olivaceomarginata]
MGAKPNSWTPALNESWTWGVNRVYGVNLGGLFVFEPFITPALFQPYPAVPDEWTLASFMRANGTLQATMEAHYDTFIVSVYLYLRSSSPSCASHHSLPFHSFSLSSHSLARAPSPPHPIPVRLQPRSHTPRRSARGRWALSSPSPSRRRDLDLSSAAGYLPRLRACAAGTRPSLGHTIPIRTSPSESRTRNEGTSARVSMHIHLGRRRSGFAYGDGGWDTGVRCRRGWAAGRDGGCGYRDGTHGGGDDVCGGAEREDRCGGRDDEGPSGAGWEEKARLRGPWARSSRSSMPRRC